jgi:hypothetical protein
MNNPHFGKKLLRAYVVLFYYVPNQNKVFLFLLSSVMLQNAENVMSKLNIF